MLSTLLLLTLAPFSSSSLAEGTAWVVDANGGGDFTEIADALPSVAEGDVLLVRPGSYFTPVSITGQGLTLVADGTGPVVLMSPLTVRDLPAASSVSLSGLELRQGFLAQDSLGPIRFQGCSTPDGANPADPPPGTNYWEWPECGSGLSRQTVSGCRGVTFVDCEFHGADGVLFTWDGAPGQHGLLVVDSSVALYDCVLAGGDGAPATASGHFSVAAGAGGDGLQLSDASSRARLTRVSAGGGLGGTFVPSANGSFGVTFGCDGVDLRAAVPAHLQVSTHPDLSFEVPSILRSATPAPLTVQGPSGALIFLMAPDTFDYRPFGVGMGVLHLDVPLNVSTLGVIPATGILESTHVAVGPVQPAGFVGLQLQTYARIDGTAFLSQPRRTVVLDPQL